MREIECVRMEGGSPLGDEYFKKLAKTVDSDIKLIDWKNAVISHHSPLILVAGTEFLGDLKKILSGREEKIIIALNSRKDFKLVNDLKDHFSKIFGFLDLSQEIDYNIPLLKNYINLNFSQNAIQLDKLASDLDKVFEFTRSELTRVKDLHDRFVKVRVDQLKGAVLTSKFMAGEKSGGEFFEIIQNDQELAFIMAGSNSYILSSIILSEFESLKEAKAQNHLEKQCEAFLKSIEHHSKENNAELSYCMMNVNMKTLQANFKVKGKGYLYYQNELLSFDRPHTLKLKPKARLCLFSEGSIKNLETLSSLTLPNFFKGNNDKNTRDLINEFFFELSRNKAGNFLIYDALLAVLEIEENVLYQLS